MLSWNVLLNEDAFPDYKIRETAIPVIDSDSKIMCLSNCKENLCGHYDTNWGCPPGFTMKREMTEYRSSVLVSREYAFERDRDPSNMMSEMQETIRNMVLMLRRNGIECDGIADGGCRYCGVCAYPEPCRFPDMLIPSVSALGIDMGRFLADCGEEFSFEEGKATMYGIILLM